MLARSSSPSILRAADETCLLSSSRWRGSQVVADCEMLAARIRARAAARASKWDSRAETSVPRKQQALRRTTLLSCVLLVIALFAFKSEIYTAWRTSFGYPSNLHLLGDEGTEQELEELQQPLVVDDIGGVGHETKASPSGEATRVEKTGHRSAAARRRSDADADPKSNLPTKVAGSHPSCCCLPEG